MKHLRTSIMALLMALSIFFNIERLDFGVDNLIDIHSFTYLLVIAAVTSILMVPKLSQWPAYYSYSLWLAVYFLLRFFVFDEPDQAIVDELAVFRDESVTQVHDFAVHGQAFHLPMRVIRRGLGAPCHRAEAQFRDRLPGRAEGNLSHVFLPCPSFPYPAT